MNLSSDIKGMTDAELIAYAKHCSAMHISLDRLQHALKIAINSLYGCVGSTYFRYFNVYQAEGITISGQGVVQTAEQAVDRLLTPITQKQSHTIAMDTDSIYVNMTDVVKAVKLTDKDKIVDFLDKLGKTKIQDTLNESFAKLAADTNAFTPAMYMKRESIGNAVFVAKKNYCMLVYDKEGVRYAQPYMSITGLEAIKSATPAFFREHLENAYRIAFEGSQSILQKTVSMVSDEYRKLPVSAISSAKSVTEVDKHIDGDTFKKGTPGHVKAVIAYNNMVKKHNLTNKYRLIKNGDKMRIVKLKVPNPAGAPVFAYINDWPTEFKLEKYIDYDSQIDAFFVKPLRRVFDQLKWNPIDEPSVDDFF